MAAYTTLWRGETKLIGFETTDFSGAFIPFNEPDPPALHVQDLIVKIRVNEIEVDKFSKIPQAGYGAITEVAGGNPHDCELTLTEAKTALYNTGLLVADITTKYSDGRVKRSVEPLYFVK